MFCKQCGAKVPDGTLFCVGCGSPMNAKPVSSSARALQGGAQQDTAAVRPPVQQPPRPVVQQPTQVQPPQPAAQQPTQVQPPRPAVQQPTQVQPPRPAAQQPTQVQPPRPAAYQPTQGQPPKPGAGYPPQPTPGYQPPQPTPITVTDPTAPAPRAAAPAPAKSGGGKGLVIALIAVLVAALVGVGVFGFLQGWFDPAVQEDDDDEPTKQGSKETSSQESPQDPGDDDHPTAEPGMVEHQWEGLTFSLPEDLEEYHWDVDYKNFYGDELRVLVASYVLSDYADDIYTSNFRFGTTEFRQHLWGRDLKILTY